MPTRHAARKPLSRTAGEGGSPARASRVRVVGPPHPPPPPPGVEAGLGAGTAVGRVRAVHDSGAADTLETARAGGPPLLVPFTWAIVPSADLAAGRPVIDPPPGLLDEPAGARRKREKATA